MEYNFSTIKLEAIYDCLRETIIEFEEELEIDALCGLTGGGRAMALSGGKSDNDFDIFYLLRGSQKPNRKYKKVVSIQGHSVEVEFNFVEFNNLKEGGRSIFDKRITAYPSILYRDEEERRRYMPNSILPRGERDDYYFAKFHSFIMGDNIWLSNKINISEYEEFYDFERTIDALDYYYTHAYGNWVYYVSKEEVINLRRYLNCMWQILSCDWILLFRHRPPSNFGKLVAKLINEDALKERIFDLYSTNCNSNVDKQNLFCRVDSVINEYIYQSLNRQRLLIETYDSNEKVKELIKNTPKEYEKKIFEIVI